MITAIIMIIVGALFAFFMLCIVILSEAAKDVVNSSEASVFSASIIPAEPVRVRT